MPDAGHFALDALRRVDAARRRQRQVEQDDVGRQLDGHGEGVATVLGLADDVEVRLVTEYLAHAHAEQGVVVDEQDLRSLVRRASVGTAPPTIRPCVICFHHFPQLLSSVGSIVSRRTVPAAGLVWIDSCEPSRSDRSRMKRSPKCRLLG